MIDKNNVVLLNASAIPEWLRQLANQFERGEHASIVLIAGDHDGGLTTVRSRSDNLLGELLGATRLVHHLNQEIDLDAKELDHL